MNIKTVENMLCTKFEIHSLGSISHYLGMEVLRIDNNFKLRQNNFIENLLSNLDLKLLKSQIIL